ncbi:hypothetical protein [Streptosporangium sp. NPDC000239]|uniref:Secreted protein n=1 Tax=Streptosporangium jomthongense TaxID=1193683 RepID=A0ABV8EVD3_9ACTN
MMARTRIAAAAVIAALAFTGTGMTAGAASASSTGAAACGVQHGEWYSSGTTHKVDVYNECSTGKYVCVEIPYWADYGPKYIPGRTTVTLLYAPIVAPEGRSIYYAASSSSC